MWTPTPGQILHQAPESSPFAAFVYWTPDSPLVDPVPVSYTAVWLSVDIPYSVTFTQRPSPLGLDVAGPDVLGMAPIEVHYQRNRVPGSVIKWNELPLDAEQVIRYVAPPVASVSANFRVDVVLSNGQVLSQEYTIQASVNYTTGRDLLVAAVDARR